MLIARITPIPYRRAKIGIPLAFGVGTDLDSFEFIYGFADRTFHFG
jgi:hypothetical protein